MSDPSHAHPDGSITADVLLTPEQLCSLGLSEVAPDALAYCLQHSLQQYLLTAIDLMRQCFASVYACRLDLEQDPETDEAWLVLAVTLNEDVETVLATYDVYTDRWIAYVPWPERDQIRLVYNVT